MGKWLHKEYFRLIDNEGNPIPDDPVFVRWLENYMQDTFVEKEDQEQVRREAVQTAEEITVIV